MTTTFDIINKTEIEIELTELVLYGLLEGCRQSWFINSILDYCVVNNVSCILENNLINIGSDFDYTVEIDYFGDTIFKLI